LQLGVESTSFICDVCDEIVAPTDKRYNCKDCVSFDLCSTCYNGRTEEAIGNHLPSHSMSLFDPSQPSALKSTFAITSLRKLSSLPELPPVKCVAYDVNDFDKYNLRYEDGSRVKDLKKYFCV
jgi:hypothetical protein